MSKEKINSKPMRPLPPPPADDKQMYVAVPTSQSEEQTIVFSATDDAVNHPSHYTWLKEICGIEPIEIIRHFDYDLGAALKYIFRAGRKHEEGISDIQKHIQDLRKAVWYLNDKINWLANQSTKNK